MNAPRYDLASSRHSRLWSNRLWILAALLGAATSFHMMGIAHDNRAWHAATDGVALAAAEQHAERVNERLQLYTLETFAPLIGLAAANGPPADALDALARAQRFGEECQCRSVLPAAEFFQVELPAGNATRQATGGRYTATTALTDTLLSQIALRDAARPRETNALPVRLTLTGPLQNYAVVTNVRQDSTGRPVAVYGLIAETPRFMSAVFNPRGERLVAGETGMGAIRLDSQSLQIGRTDSTPLFGRLAADRPHRARVLLHGPMDGLGMSVALATAETQVSRPPQSPARLWALGVLMISTVLVLVIAVTTSRREMFLARARSDFIAGTSHDFRMPLAQILLAGETLNLQPEVSAGERNDLSRSIVRETRRLITMVENVLLYSRSGAVEIKPSLQAIPVSQLFEDVCESVQLAADEHNQVIETVGDVACSVNADRQLVRQALVNLVDNAMKYGRPGQTVHLGAQQHSTTHVHLFVDDEGPGIPVSQRARVFEPYERLVRDQASQHAGSGLGLAVVYHIAKVCGGRVWIGDAPGGGARVTLELQSAAS